MYEISGKIKFEGEELYVKLEELTCSGDQEFSVKGKKKEEREKLKPFASKIVSLVVEVFNRYKEWLCIFLSLSYCIEIATENY